MNLPKEAAKLLAGIIILVILAALLTLYCHKQAENNKQSIKREYQLDVDSNSIYLYNSDNQLIGRCNYTNTSIDSLLRKDNE